MRAIREFFRKLIVSLKRKPQTIAFLVLIAGFMWFTLNLTAISDTTALIKNGAGLSAFITLLASTLSLVTFLRSYPHRQKTRIVMLALTFVLLLGAMASDYWYHGLIIRAYTKEGNEIVYAAENADADAREMIVRQARKIDEEAAKAITDQVLTDGGINEEAIKRLVAEGAIGAPLADFYKDEAMTSLKTKKGVETVIKNDFTDVRDSIRTDGSDSLSADTLDLAKLREVIAAGTLGTKTQLFDEEGKVIIEGLNAAYRGINGEDLLYTLNCSSAGTVFLIKKDYGFTTRAHRVLIVHEILLGVGVLLTALKPLYAKLIRKINTSIEVAGNQDMEAIDISGEG